MGSTASRDKEVTDRIDTDFLDEFFHGDGISCSLAHLELLTIFEESDHLNQSDIERIGIMSEIFLRRFQSGDIAVVICAEEVDEKIKPAVEFIVVIGDIGQEVGVISVALDQDTIFVITIFGGVKPQGAFFFIAERS